jgi:hypothetical protein
MLLSSTDFPYCYKDFVQLVTHDHARYVFDSNRPQARDAGKYGCVHHNLSDRLCTSQLFSG